MSIDVKKTVTLVDGTKWEIPLSEGAEVYELEVKCYKLQQNGSRVNTFQYPPTLTALHVTKDMIGLSQVEVPTEREVQISVEERIAEFLTSIGVEFGD